MNKGMNRLWLILSIVCLVIGLALMLTPGLRDSGEGGSAPAIAPIVKGFSSDRVEQKEFLITDPFESLTVIDSSADVSINSSWDEQCRVHCSESDRLHYSVSVQEGVLTVRREDSGAQVSLFEDDLSLQIYLPAAHYRTLKVETSSGEIDSDGPDWDQVQLKSSSGDIWLWEISTGALEIESSSGETYLSDVQADSLRIQSVSGGVSVYGGSFGEISVSGSSGDVSVSSLSAGKTQIRTVSGAQWISFAQLEELQLKSSSGDLDLSGTSCAGSLSANTVSGQIYLTETDATGMELSSSSGDISGTLLGEWEFRVETGSGTVFTSESRPGARLCHAVTVSGDVDLFAED